LIVSFPPFEQLIIIKNKLHLETAYIYHISSRSWWEAAQKAGQLSSPRFEEEGYIHCATLSQIPGVLERYFQNQTDLVRLTIDKAKVKPPLVYELAGKLNEVFPHVHGPINLDAVIAVDPI
jgi:uncharacterized protein (DUF952 family)